MPRADRLFRLLDALRRLPPPATAERLAEVTEVSVRSIYRDIAALRASGARIDGEAGYGYVLAEDPALPPQSLTRIEIEALILGMAEVRHSGDRDLAEAAESLLAKVIARLPERGQREAAHAISHAFHKGRPEMPRHDLNLIREACWEERALDLRYRAEDGPESARRIWPLTIAYLDARLIVLGWCHLRQDFRQFRIDRIMSVAPTTESFRPRRVGLLRDYVASLPVPASAAVT